MEKNIFKIVEETLKTNNEYISEDGKLLKAKVYTDIMTMNNKLLSLLISNTEIKEKFFTKIDEVLVFDKQKFSWFIESKEFLPDSYTRYTNKIGLTNNSEFISKSNDVVLDFPYKDCVLEGGQDKEDQKRNEKFYNELIAKDEISNMLTPKVFTNAKRYTKEGIEENITFNDNDNLIIKGNNLIALSSLLKRYEGKVKCIYIDPPYNTGNDSFGYNDSFNHSTWLTFMKNRLILSKELLSNNGVIFVQCDDNEQAYLKVLMDEIFGNYNFVGTAPRKTKGSVTTKSNSELQKLHDYIHIYFKNKSVGSFNLKLVGTKSYPYSDIRGNYYIVPLQDNGPHGTKEARPNLYYPIYALKDGSLTYQKNNNIINTYLPSLHKGKEGCWMWSKKKFDKDNKDLTIINGKIYIKHYFNKEEDQNKYQKEKIWLENFLNLKGTKTLKQMNLTETFNNPKPEELIQFILNLSTKENDITLDFFNGSGTTTAVAHKMNRRYIGVEQMDYINTITVPRMQKVIAGEQSGISKSINWQGGGSFVYCELLENANELIIEIENSDENNISYIKEKIYSDERIIPYITKNELEEIDDEFENLSLEEKKKALIKLIDKNKLYVNYSNIEDKTFNVKDSDKTFTKSFYEET